MQKSLRPGQCWPRKAVKQAPGQQVAKRIQHDRVLTALEEAGIVK